MSQAGEIDILGTHPEIPTEFVANVGTAVPILNVIEILGSSVVAHLVPVQTVASGNTLTVDVQLASTNAASLVSHAGLASFSSTDFTVDANGFVTFTNTGYVKSVSGTANRITSTGGQNPVIDIAATYVGQTSITTLGTITTGVWNGSTIGPTFGGTGISTYATGDVLYASAANTLAKLPAASNGQVLTLAAGIPSWATPATGTIQTIAGDSGSITGAAVTIFSNNAANNSGASVKFVNSGTTSTLNFTDANSNTFIGNLSGNLSFNQAANNSGFGANSLSVIVSATGLNGLANSAFGSGSLAACTTGSNNCAFGRLTLNQLTTSGSNVAVGISCLQTASTASFNTAIGQSVFNALLTGARNIGIGAAGTLYVGAESDNILINNTGTAAESHTIRIGTNGSGSGQQNRFFAAGIASVSVSNLNVVTIDTTTGQLGSQADTIGTVTSVSGTADQVAVATGTTTPVISLIGPYTPATYTAHGILLGQGTSSITALSPVAAGKIVQSGGAAADPVYSTATYPGTATGTGTILRADGTNWVATTATYPATTTSQQILYSTANNVIGELTTANSALAATNSSGTLAMRLFSVVTQVFTSTGTYTPTAGMLYCEIEAVGGGGGGGSAVATSSVQTSIGGGGGGGGYAKKTFSAATIGASKAVTIGAAGTAGTAGGAGGTGGTTSVGATILSAAGGVGGGSSAAQAGANIAAGGGGGAGSTGDYNTVGTPGGFGFSSFTAGSFASTAGGAGGSSYFGGGATPVATINTANTAGNAATSYGGGGSGAANGVSGAARDGGVGFKGLVVVTEYVIA